MQLDPEVRSRFYDIADCCEWIAKHLAGVVFDDFFASRLIRSAVERELITIGEAVRIILQIDEALESHVTDARGIVDLRNLLVHGYRRLDPRTLWTIATIEVPVLLSETQILLGAGPNPA